MQELLDIAIKAAKSAGDEIIKNYSNYKISKKEDDSPVTSADLAANDALFFWLERTGYPICSEERPLSDEERINAGCFWLLDPLDGTKHFIKGDDEFCVCIALINDGRPILSVIYIPKSREMFYSMGYKMVYKNGILLNKNFDENNILIAGQKNFKTQMQSFIDNFNFKTVTCGSAIKFCRLAENAAGVYLRFKETSLWDTAAGDFLLSQMGGITINLRTGETIKYDQDSLTNDEFLAVGPGNMSKLTEYLDFINKEKLLK